MALKNVSPAGVEFADEFPGTDVEEDPDFDAEDIQLGTMLGEQAALPLVAEPDQGEDATASTPLAGGEAGGM